MGLSRSTYYDAPHALDRDAEILARITAIGEEFEAYGYRRVCAELRHQGVEAPMAVTDRAGQFHGSSSSS